MRKNFRYSICMENYVYVTSFNFVYVLPIWRMPSEKKDRRERKRERERERGEGGGGEIIVRKECVTKCVCACACLRSHVTHLIKVGRNKRGRREQEKGPFVGPAAADRAR